MICTDFWYKRHSDARVFVGALCTSNFFFQINAILKPMTPEHLIVNQIYMVGTLITFALVIASVKFKKHSGMLLHLAFALVIPR